VAAQRRKGEGAFLMAILYVLDVPEFSPLVAYAEGASDLNVSAHGAYHKIESAGDLLIPRAETGMDPAIWFGGLVGGFEGQIAEFNETTLKIV